MPFSALLFFRLPFYLLINVKPAKLEDCFPIVHFLDPALSIPIQYSLANPISIICFLSQRFPFLAKSTALFHPCQHCFVYKATPSVFRISAFITDENTALKFMLY